MARTAAVWKWDYSQTQMKQLVEYQRQTVTFTLRLYYLFQIFIHPFSQTICQGHGIATGEQECRYVYNKVLLRDSQLLPGHSRDVIPQAGPGLALWSRSRWLCLVHLQTEWPMRHPKQLPKPPQLASLHAEELPLCFVPLPDLSTNVKKISNETYFCCKQSCCRDGHWLIWRQPLVAIRSLRGLLPACFACKHSHY